MTTRCARCADENTEGEGLGWQKESSSFVLCFNRSEAKRVSNMKRAAATIATPTAIFSTAPLFFFHTHLLAKPVTTLAHSLTYQITTAKN